MAFIAFMRDIKSSAGVFFSQEELVDSNPLASATHSPSSAKLPQSAQAANASQIISLRQSYHGPPWGVNIPPYRQLAVQSSSPSSCSSSFSLESSLSSAFDTRRSQRSLVTSDLKIESTINSDNPSRLPQIHNSPQVGSHSQVNPPNKPVSINNLKYSDDSTTSRPQSVSFMSKYPKPVIPVEFTTIESAVIVPSRGAQISSSSFCSLPSVGSPTDQLRQSLSPDSGRGLNSSPVNQSPIASSPRATSSPVTCHTCRFPRQHTSSESSFPYSLSHRSSLFGDLDEDTTSHWSDPSLLDTQSIEDSHHSSSASSFISSSPEAPHSLGSWWSDIPPHRRAHIIEADSWPIFTPTAPLTSNDSPSAEHCVCPAASTHHSSPESSGIVFTDQNHHSKEPLYVGSPPSPSNLQSRPSFSKNLNLLVPIPLNQDEADPLLLTSLPHSDNLPLLPTAIENLDSQNSDTTSQPMKRKKRKEELLPKSSESLLTKSLRRLSRKLPNIQWGNLSVRMQSSTIDGKSATPGEEEPEEESVLPSGVVDEDSLVALAYEDEKAQISRLVKSWTLDNIQPQNSLNGSFINDPEMEWSSMVVQLETFSPSSGRKSRSNLQIPAEKKMPRSTRTQQYSRKGNNTNMDSGTHRSHERSKSLDQSNDASTHENQRPVKSPSRKNNRSIRNKQHQLNHENKKNQIKIIKRVVSNPLHLLQLTLELEMMRKMKINSPLKQRSMKLILTKRGPGSQSVNNSNQEFDYVGSPLRYEIL